MSFNIFNVVSRQVAHDYLHRDIDFFVCRARPLGISLECDDMETSLRDHTSATGELLGCSTNSCPEKGTVKLEHNKGYYGSI